MKLQNWGGPDGVIGTYYPYSSRCPRLELGVTAAAPPPACCRRANGQKPLERLGVEIYYLWMSTRSLGLLAEWYRCLPTQAFIYFADTGRKKFSLADIEERKFWKHYMRAFEQCISATSTRNMPWYIVLADN